MLRIPEGAKSHRAAGPYSPVLEVTGNTLVVISGTASQDMDGRVIGDTIEEQTEVVIENCKRQLSKAGCTLADVFKVNVYLKDLNEWSRFNAVYSQHFQEPRPVRTAVQTGLIEGFKVEVEMWAMKE